MDALAGAGDEVGQILICCNYLESLLSWSRGKLLSSIYNTCLCFLFAASADRLESILSAQIQNPTEMFVFVKRCSL